MDNEALNTKVKVDEALIDRIMNILELKGLNLSFFAGQVGVSKSALSHILKNKRNNPSLDMLKKILEKYGDINSNWLIFGEGTMLKSEKPIIQTSLFNEDVIESPKETIKQEYSTEKQVKLPTEPIKPPIIEEIKPQKNDTKKVSKIMIFYNDNTFECFTSDMQPFE